MCVNTAPPTPCLALPLYPITHTHTVLDYLPTFVYPGHTTLQLYTHTLPHTLAFPAAPLLPPWIPYLYTHTPALVGAHLVHIYRFTHPLQLVVITCPGCLVPFPSSLTWRHTGSPLPCLRYYGRPAPPFPFQPSPPLYGGPCLIFIHYHLPFPLFLPRLPLPFPPHCIHSLLGWVLPWFPHPTHSSSHLPTHTHCTWITPSSPCPSVGSHKCQVLPSCSDPHSPFTVPYAPPCPTPPWTLVPVVTVIHATLP